MSERDETENTVDPGEKMLGCVRWVLGVPMMGLGLLGVAVGLLSLAYGCISMVASGKYEGFLIMLGSSLAVLLVGAVFGGVGYLMITSGTKKRSTDIGYP